MKPYERRFFLLELTPTGAAAADQTRRVIEVELSRWFVPTFSDQDANTLLELLARRTCLDPAAAGQRAAAP